MQVHIWTPHWVFSQEKGYGDRVQTLIPYLWLHPYLYLNFNQMWFCNVWKYIPENQINAQQVSVTTITSRSDSARMTGTPTLDGVCSCRFGVSLSQLAALEFVVQKHKAWKWGKPLAMMHPIMHPSYKEPKAGSTARSNKQPSCSKSLSRPEPFILSHLPGSGRGWGQRTAFEWCPQFSRKKCDLSCSFLLSHWLQHCSKTAHLLQALQPCSCCAWLPGLRHHRQGDDGEIENC